MHDAQDVRDLVADEVVQRRQAGFDVEAASVEVERALDERAAPDVLSQHLDALERADRVADWPFAEIETASELVSMAERTPMERMPIPPDIDDRIHGAWLGRCAGCLLGKPVEGWTRGEIAEYLREAEVWPLDGFIPAVDPYPPTSPPMKPSWVESTRGSIRGMPRDDDLDYTVVSLLALERRRGRICADDVAAEWLARLPIGQLFTAERAAYRNLVLGLKAPATATHRNPYREWIGALIRADAYAYINPGDPLSAARLAATDASVSHVGNGISAAMWAASVISLALSGMPPDESVPRAAALVPERTRLRAILDRIVASYRAGGSMDDVLAEVDPASTGYGWVHAIPNTAIIAASLLWGHGDFERSICLAVGAGCDTDSNGATVGSAAGALLGARSLPTAWTAPLHDTLRTSVAGYGATRISELARRTMHLVDALGSAS